MNDIIKHRLALILGTIQAFLILSEMNYKIERLPDMQMIRQHRGSPSWFPLDQLNSLRDEMNRLMERPLADFGHSNEFFNGWIPAVDILENKDNVVVRVELPGMKKEDIDISLHEGVLSITGERKQREEDQGNEVYRSERFYGRFHRTVTLPKPVAADKVKAGYKDGLLTITLPKTEEAKPRQIEVSVG